MTEAQEIYIRRLRAILTRSIVGTVNCHYHDNIIMVDIHTPDYGYRCWIDPAEEDNDEAIYKVLSCYKHAILNRYFKPIAAHRITL